jgi:hypothetical protein
MCIFLQNYLLDLVDQVVGVASSATQRAIDDGHSDTGCHGRGCLIVHTVIVHETIKLSSNILHNPNKNNNVFLHAAHKYM